MTYLWLRKFGSCNDAILLTFHKVYANNSTMEKEKLTTNNNQLELGDNAWLDSKQKLSDLIDSTPDVIHAAAEAEANGEELGQSRINKLGEIAVRSSLTTDVAAMDKTAEGRFKLPEMPPMMDELPTTTVEPSADDLGDLDN